MKIIKILLLLIIIAIVAVFFMRDSIAKYAIEKYGLEVLTTTVNVNGVQTDVFDKNVSVSELVIANPAGFEGNALTVANIAVDVEHIDELIVINSISIDGVVATIMQNAGGINLMQLKDAVTNTITQKHDDRDDEHNDMRIKVGSFAITNSMVDVDTDIIKEQINLPDVTLRNIGGDNGMLMSEFAPYIIGYLAEQVEGVLSTEGISMLEDKLEQTLVKKLGERLGIDVDTTDDIKNAIEGSLSGAKESLGEKTQDLKNQLNEQKEKLKDIFKF